MLQIILTVNAALIFKYICEAALKCFAFSGKVEIARLICNHTELTKDKIAEISKILEQ